MLYVNYTSIKKLKWEKIRVCLYNGDRDDLVERETVMM